MERPITTKKKPKLYFPRCNFDFRLDKIMNEITQIDVISKSKMVINNVESQIIVFLSMPQKGSGSYIV